MECQKEEVLVFTRHPQGDCYTISNKTILGKGGPQYLGKVVYKLDRSNSQLVPAPEAQKFELDNMPALLKAKQEAPTFKVIELAKIIANE